MGLFIADIVFRRIIAAALILWHLIKKTPLSLLFVDLPETSSVNKTEVQVFSFMEL